MSRYTLRPRAEQDLVQHEEYLAENASVEIARRFLDAVEESLGLLATQPEMGARRAYRRAELQGQRMWPIQGFENYLAFYFPTDYGVDVTRVLYATRNIKRIFEVEGID